VTDQKLAEMMSDIQYLFKENLRLRSALADCGNAVGGAVVPTCSIEFLECVTQEVRLVTERLRRERAEALLDAERAREERNREHVRLNAEWIAKCEELRKDALRYKWLRDGGREQIDMFNSLWGESLDWAIDAALAKKEGA
jgi:hypothetical protein